MIAFFSNTINKHQVYLADQLYNKTGGQYIYVETVAPTSANLSGGKAKVERPYVLAAYKSSKDFSKAMKLAREADVALFGADSFQFEQERMNLESPGIAFEVSERWLKRGWINLCSPRLLRFLWNYHTKKWKDKPLYKLCASAYCAGDHFKLHTFKNRCYKWGYFTRVSKIEDSESSINQIHSISSIMWCARFLTWKHPEMVIQLAKMLKNNGYKVSINMFGTGKELKSTKELCQKYDVTDVVFFKGSVSNDVILSEMRRHDIFLITSDRNEGWGVVVNEAMSNRCAVVGSNEVGCVPYLIHDGVSGMVFQSKSVESLYEKVVFLLEHPDKRKQIADFAYQKMVTIWNPENAANKLLELIDDLTNNRKTSNQDGPASKI